MLLAEAFAIPLFQQALVAGLLVSVACGIIGTYVVVKRMASLSGGLSHTAFGGVGIGYFFGFSPMLGALGFCVLSSVLLGHIYRHRAGSLDTLVAIFWSLGMALGMLFISLTPGYAPDLSAYLFGSIVFVPPEYLQFAFLLDVLIVISVLIFFREFQAIAFDEEFSEVAGLPVERIFVFLLILTALTVVTLMRVAGVILTISLLTTPSVIARDWCQSLRQMMFFSVIITGITILTGLLFSYWLSAKHSLEVPTGPLIIVLLSMLYALSSVIKAILTRKTLD